MPNGVPEGVTLSVDLHQDLLHLEGEWLEDLVYHAARQAGLDSVATNVSRGWQDAPEREMNEIDVAVVHRLRFYYLSCKTGSDAQQRKHHLFELETLSSLAGGLFNRPILVASNARAVPAALRRRMETLGIAYVGPADLSDLAGRLKEIMRYVYAHGHCLRHYRRPPAAPPLRSVAQVVKQQKRRYLRQTAQGAELVVTEPGVYIGKTSSRLVGKKQRRVITEIPLRQLRHVIITTSAVSLSAAVIALCGWPVCRLIFSRRVAIPSPACTLSRMPSALPG